jgi:heme exporter protein CcmD
MTGHSAYIWSAVGITVMLLAGLLAHAYYVRWQACKLSAELEEMP